MSAQQQSPKPGQGEQQPNNNPGQDQNDISRPGKPGNDPDQTPEREVKNPPKADPNKDKGKQPYK